jgi:hypothetical protein
VFQKKYEEKYDKYYNNVNSGHPVNMKNNSSGVRGIFGSAGTGDADTTLRNETSRGAYYDGMLPNLSITKKECKLL